MKQKKEKPCNFRKTVKFADENKRKEANLDLERIANSPLLNLGFNKQEWIDETIKSEFQHLYLFLKERQVPANLPLTDSILGGCDHFCIIDELFYYITFGGEVRLYVPKIFRKKILEEHHKCDLPIHWRKLYLKLREMYWWPALFVDCHNIGTTCS